MLNFKNISESSNNQTCNQINLWGKYLAVVHKCLVQRICTSFLPSDIMLFTLPSLARDSTQGEVRTKKKKEHTLVRDPPPQMRDGVGSLLHAFHST